MEIPMFAAGAAAVPESGSPSAGQQPQTATKVRTEFPETWLWSESTTGYHMTLSVIRAVKFDSPSMSKLSAFIRCHAMAFV